jgi:hypothetical protein
MTLVREPAEEALLRQALRALVGHGLPVFVADGGSGQTFVDFLQTLPDVTLVRPKGPGLVGQVQASLAAAAAATNRFVLYTESDKLDFFDRHLQQFLAAAESEPDAGCLLASRSISAFSTFPPTQQSTEAAINRLCGQFLNAEGDYSYGPFLLKASLAASADAAAGDLGWGWRHLTFALAHRFSQRLVHTVGDYECPADQRGEASRDRLHRLRQLRQNVDGLLAGLTVTLPATRELTATPSGRSQTT